MTSTDKLNCIFCKDTFDSKDELQIHFRKHGDPKFNQVVKSCKTRPPSEALVGSEKSNDECEVVSCDVCSDVFPTISKAITHKHKMHPDHDAKYFCPWCGKLFTMKHLYNKHIEQTHQDSIESSDTLGFHCDYCDVDFFSPSAMVNHNKFFHRQDTELASLGHSRKLKKYNQELLQIYYCPFCGEEYYNKVNLHKHMGDDHIDENQSPDDVLRCPLCDAIFYHLDAYELHLTFHSADDMYSEENEVASTTTEFSLETVPPLMEKVENEMHEEDDGSIGILELLQQGMNESCDNDNSNSQGLLEKKSKKHKKHKKKKKEAITLDEFLNMNKDVFGEGIDCQGIVEVPTHVVAKQLKRAPLKVKAGPTAASSEIQKLKRQGITVKMKPRNNKLQGMKVAKFMNKPTNAQSTISNKIQVNSETKSTAKESSSEVLSKLLNQNNSQIKIVKKSSQNDINREHEQDIKKEKKSQNLELENTENIKGLSADQGLEPNSEHLIAKCNDTKHKIQNEDPALDTSAAQECLKNNQDIEKNNENNHDIDKSTNEELVSTDDTDMDAVCPDSRDQIKVDIKIKKSASSLDVLRNIGITVKPISSPKAAPQKPIPELEIDNREQQDKKVEADSENILEAKAKQKQSSPKSTSLNALKHLDHLVVKQVSKTITVAETKEDDEEERTDNGIEDAPAENIDEKIKFGLNESKSMEKQIATAMKDAPAASKDTKSLDTLKSLSKHITIKPLNSPNIDKTKTDTHVYEDTSEEENEDLATIKRDCQKVAQSKSYAKLTPNNKFVQKTADQSKTVETNPSLNQNPQLNRNFDQSYTKLTPNNPFVQKTAEQSKNLKTNPSLNQIPKLSKNLALVSDIQKQNMSNVSETKIHNKQTCANLLKQLPNVTAKPVVQKITQQVTMKSTNNSMNVQRGSFVQKCVKQEETKEEIEIFNIDDSDEEDNAIIPPQKQVTSPSTNLLPTTTQKIRSLTGSYSGSEKSLEALKNISKNVTIKSNNQIPVVEDDIPNTEEMLNNEYIDSDDDNFDNERKYTHTNLQNHKNIALKNTLKNISKHVTVKTSNLTPKIFGNSKMKKEFPEMPADGTESDNESCSGQVRITELEDDFDDGDIDYKQEVARQKSNDVAINSPNESDVDDDLDVEKLIKLNEIKSEPKNKNDDALNALRNIGIQIKSSRANKMEEERPEVTHDDEKSNFATESPVKSHKQKMFNEDGDSNRNKQTLGRTTNQSIVNKQVGSSGGQINTVNKEVTVKTFQTKTVIEEITTTVTKTIRTVNQTVKQEVRNMNVSNLERPTPMRPQILGMNTIQPNQRIKNYPVTPIRQMTQTAAVGAKIRNAVPVRPSMNTAIRSQNANQLVPLRPVMNMTRPRMPAMKKVAPSNLRQPVIGTPLKISPSAMLPTMKRPSEDASGPFSCFKKPKESLIPVSDVPSFNNSQSDSSTVHYASSSQMNRSNFCSTTKVTKGNAVVTSTQMKSEVNASSEQLSRLSNMSGLKVVKTSQVKQASHVEERNEISAPMRSTRTLEAIEKLQKQGLLVKRPRVEEDNFSDHSNSEDDET